MFAGERIELRFAALNRSYSNVVEDLEPIEIGPALVELSTPDHTFTLFDHVAVVEALGGGVFDIRIEVDAQGEGDLIADLTIAAMRSHLVDRLVLPRQDIVASGQVRVETVAEGWWLTLVDSQDEVVVHIESRMAGRIVPLCRQMSLVLVALDCDLLERTLSEIHIPAPEPGTRFFLSREDVSPEEALLLQAFLDRF